MANAGWLLLVLVAALPSHSWINRGKWIREGRAFLSGEGSSMQEPRLFRLSSFQKSWDAGRPGGGIFWWPARSSRTAKSQLMSCVKLSNLWWRPKPLSVKNWLVCQDHIELLENSTFVRSSSAWLISLRIEFCSLGLKSSLHRADDKSNKCTLIKL